jgi:glycosyltransferase involved in cell wall biosynthesis
MSKTITSAQPGAGAERPPEPLRVLAVGGEDHHLRIPFLLELRKRGVHVGAAGTGAPDPFLEHDIAYFRYDFDRFVDPLADWRALESLAQIIAVFGADIVQAFDTKPCILVPVAARRLERTGVVRTVNGLGWVFSSRSPMALALRPVLNALYRLTAPMTQLTVFQNRSDQEFFERKRMIGRGGSQMIPGSGIDVAGFQRALDAGPPPQALREALGLGDSEVVTTVSRLSRVKGIETLLRAAVLVREQRPGVRFLLVGSRETEGRFACSQAEIDRHAPYVKAIGSRTDVPALLRLSNVFAFPTELCEGIPRVLLEAALAGVPIVTTDMPGCADVVEDGVSGFVVPARQPQRLADRIIDLLDDPVRGRAMAERARAHVGKDLNLDITVERYAQAYARLCRPQACSQAPLTRERRLSWSRPT